MIMAAWDNPEHSASRSQRVKLGLGICLRPSEQFGSCNELHNYFIYKPKSSQCPI